MRDLCRKVRDGVQGVDMDNEHLGEGYRKCIAVECSLLAINLIGYKGTSGTIHGWVNKSGCASRKMNGMEYGNA